MKLISLSLAAMIMICSVPSTFGADEPDMQFEFHRGRVPATELKLELAVGESVVKDTVTAAAATTHFARAGPR